MSSKENKRKLLSSKAMNERRVADQLNKVENPIRNSIIIAFVWEVILIGFGIGLYFINELGWAKNFNTIFAIGLGIAIFWVILKFGLFEGPRLKFKNYTNKKIVNKMDINSKNITLSLEQYRELNKKRSWIGVYVLIGMNIVGLVSTLPLII